MRRVFSIGLGVAVLAGGGVLVLHISAAPACRDRAVIATVSEILRDQYHLDSILLNDVTTVSGGFFATRAACSAEVTQIKGNVNASNMRWQQVSYDVAAGEPPVVTVRLGGDVPLAGPEKSFWASLRARL